MEWRGYKERVCVVLLFIYKLRFTTFLLILVFLFAVSNIGRFLTDFALFMTICEIALVNFALLQIKKMRPTSKIALRTQEIAAQTVAVRSELSDCGSSHDFPHSEAVKSAVHWSEWVRRFQGVVLWALEFVERQILQDIDEEGLVAEIRLEGCDSAQVTKDTCEGAVINFSNREVTAKVGLSEEYSLTYNSKNTKDAVLALDCRRNMLSNASPQDSDEIDVPELEDCSSSGEEEEICKTVLESTCVASMNSNTKEDEVMDTNILEPTSKAADRPICLDEGANSVDKHQILPPELSGKTLLGSNTEIMQLPVSLNSIAKDVNDVAHKLEVQLADAGDFYTLEGDVLWHESDISNSQDGNRLDGFRPTSKRHQVSELQARLQDQGFSSDYFTISPYKIQQSHVETVVMSFPSNSEDHQADSIALDKNVRSLFESTETQGSSKAEINEDALIDQELRAIAFGGSKRGEDTAFVSSTTSFREVEECWPEFCADCISPTELCIGNLYNGCNSSVMGVKETGISDKLCVGVGCCDQPRACIAHSRSRSKVLQSDPLLSSESLIREQEMDVLWQQYNEDSSRKSNVSRQRIKTQGRLAVKQGDVPIGEKISPDDLSSVADLSPLKSGDTGSSRVDGCWQTAYKARRFPRRKYFVGICRVLKELGLKQCIQGSKVKN